MIAIQPVEGTIYNSALISESVLPTMYDLPSESTEEPGLPDEFHYYQSQLLRETFQPPDYLPNRYFVGTDINLYYDPSHTRWYKRPDWFAVLGAARSQQQQNLRWSYVVWQEHLIPYLVVELLSPGTEAEDLGCNLWDIDKTPTKWVVYERILKIPYYLTYSRYSNELKAFGHVSSGYKELALQNNQLWLPEATLGLSIWEGCIEGYTGNWLRFYDHEGKWLPTATELVIQETQRANAETAARHAAEAEITRLKTLLGL